MTAPVTALVDGPPGAFMPDGEEGQGQGQQQVISPEEWQEMLGQPLEPLTIGLPPFQSVSDWKGDTP